MQKSNNKEQKHKSKFKNELKKTLTTEDTEEQKTHREHRATLHPTK